MDLQALKTEITTDLAGLGYAGKTEVEIAELLNSPATGRTGTNTITTRAVDAMSLVDLPEYFAVRNAGTAGKNALLDDLVAMSPYQTPAHKGVALAIIKEVFGATSKTIQNMGAALIVPVSRADELGLGHVTSGDVQRSGVI